MSGDIAIRVRGLGKKYTIGGPQERYQTFRDAIVNSMKAPLRRLTQKGADQSANEFWALKNVSFDVHKGEIIGIIGRNGAGKSTILKILSRITTPTEGEVDIYGRVGSLLEVGTGFHSELTGRENIYLSGSILGMRRSEIEEKFDEIVKFSEIDKFIDTPVKRYSSGMYVRLAFAVAAHLDPEILMVDEVLAVGDAAFQRKCLGKMGSVAKEGRTVLFVSHNMGAIKTLCSKSALFDKGRLVEFGSTNEIISKYLGNIIASDSIVIKSGDFVGQLYSCRTINANFETMATFSVKDQIGIEIKYKLFSDRRNTVPNYLLSSEEGTEIFHCICTTINECSLKGDHTVVCWIPQNFLNNKNYRVLIALVTLNPVEDHAIQEISFQVIDDLSSPLRGDYRNEMHGLIRPQLCWELINNEI